MSPSGNSPLPSLPPRDHKGHKGTFGTVSIIGGCSTADRVMAGAPALAALAALRAGCGLARLIIPAAITPAALTICPSATCTILPTSPNGLIIPSEACAVLDAAAGTSSCLVIGPGMGGDSGVARLTLRALQQEEIPVVVDADAMNALATIPDLHLDLRAPAILTPHPGEFRRLATALRITADPTSDASRPAAAEEMARRMGAIVVLKGAGTVVSNGLETWTCRHGHSCLATAGTGDVLAGLIAGLVAQHGPRRGTSVPGTARTLSVFDNARIAVQAHALAGEQWAASHSAQAGLLAPELAAELPAILAKL